MTTEQRHRGLSRVQIPVAAAPRFVQASVAFSKRKPLGALGGAALMLLMLIAIFAPVISPHDPELIDARYLVAPPGRHYPLGGDALGRDVLSRLFFGARISLLVGLVSVGIGITSGGLLGVVSAFSGGKIDLVVQRIVDAVIAFPTIILALTIMSVLGASLTNVIIALVFSMAPHAVRTVRSQALAVREMDYVMAARAVGASSWRIILQHVIPNCMAIFIVLFTLALGSAIVAESSLSFLGLGVPPQTPTWGSMLEEASGGYLRTAPWMAISPGVALASAVFAINLLGDALRDFLDPRLRGQ